MTKQEYMKKVMRLRPSAKDWRELAEKAIRSGCIDYESAVDYRQVYPLAIAIAERIASWQEEACRYIRREVRNIKHFI